MTKYIKSQENKPYKIMINFRGNKKKKVKKTKKLE